MECQLSTTHAPCAVTLPRCGAADVRVLGTVQQNTSTTLVLFIANDLVMIFFDNLGI